MNKYAVITGDIVGSRKIINKQHMIDSLLEVFSEINLDFKSKIDFEIFRGDSFQCVIANPRESLKLFLLLKSGFMSKSIGKELYNIRVSIGIGKIEFPNENIKIGNGIAYQLSGIELDKMKSNNYKILMKILFPRVTPPKEYDRSLFYYKYIVENDLKEIEKTFGKVNSTKSILISDLKSVSVILNEKIKYISQTLVLMTLNILFTIITVLLIKAL